MGVNILGTYRDDANKLSELNNSNTPLLANDSFTGEWESCILYDSVTISCLSDQDGTLYIQFRSNETAPINTLPAYKIYAGVNSVHRLTVTRAQFRLIFTNGTVDQSSFDLHAILGAQTALTSPLKGSVSQDADASIVRTVPNLIEIAAGKFSGWSIIPKVGRNSDIDSGTLPEDVIESGGTYQGFVDKNTPQRMWLVSSSASDTGYVTFIYLASKTSTAWQSTTIQLQGTTPVDTGIDAIRAHTMYYNAGDVSTFNVGTITLRNAGSTVTWLTIITGRSQSNYMVYTVPYGNTAYITLKHGSIRGGASSYVDGMDIYLIKD